ncbi:MAG: FecR domain-containing protein [Verrucomicrobiales bacterium]
MKLLLGITLLAMVVAQAVAAPLREAEFTRVINDVKILPEAATPAPAKVGDKISGRTGVATGVQSRAELRYPDQTLTRLGANSVFRMDQKTRTAEVEKGVILLQVPKQLGGAQVRTAAVTAAVTGTTLLVEYTPDGFIKIIVIEGEVDVFLNNRRSVFRTLTPGDLWITRANDASTIPLPVKIDLKRLQKTSKLLDAAEFSQLGNSTQMQDALNEQARLKQDGELIATSFRIEGRGRQVTLTQGERQHIVGGRPLPVRRPAETDQPVLSSQPPRAPSPEVIVPNKPINVAESTVFDERSAISTGPGATAFNSATGSFGPLPGSAYAPLDDRPFNVYMYDDPTVFTGIDAFLDTEDSWFVFKGDEIFLSGDVVIDTTGGPRSLILGSTRDFRFTDQPPFAESGLSTGNTWNLDDAIDSLAFTSLSGSVIFDDFSLLGGAQNVLLQADGPTSDVLLLGGGSARLSLPQGAFEAVAGRDIRVEGGSLEARTVALQSGRDVQIGRSEAPAVVKAAQSLSVKAQQTITIASTSQLRQLTETDALSVLLEAANGSLNLEPGATIEADAINLASLRGDLNINGARLSAREINARVFDTGGTLLINNALLGRGASPADLIRLYGEGAGGVRFTGDTTLNGQAVDIAGRSVTIDPGSRVRLANPTGTRVFADSHNYNNRTNGNFTGTAPGQAGARPVDVNQQPFANRPAP